MREASYSLNGLFDRLSVLIDAAILGQAVNISIELVPRDEDSLHADLQTISQNFSQVNMINIPDLLRFKTRSWHGCSVAKAYYQNTIPHIRAVDFSCDEAFPLVETLEKSGIDTVLVVTGDAPKSDLHPIYPTSSIDLIRKIKQEAPNLRIFAAIDPYRQDFQNEYRYAMAKLEAGAEGFFSQPFFDLRLMQIYSDLLPDTEIYWGVSPVITKRSQEYWEATNKAIFPKHFEPSLEWNRQFAKEALDFAESNKQHIYYMPIRVDLLEYLGGIL